MNPGRWCRALRAAVFAATCVLLATLGHVLVSGTPVPWWAMSVAFAATAGAAWLLAGRERGVLAVTSVTLGVQAALHCGFSLAQAVGHPSGGTSLARQWAQYLLCRGTSDSAPLPAGGALRAVPDPLTAHAGHSGHSGHVMADMAVPVPTGHDAGGMSPTGMLAAHLLAALLCGLWLAYGERGAFRVLRACAGWLLTPLHLVFRLPEPPHRPRLRVCRESRTRPPRQLLLDHAITSRGPPLGTAVL